MGPQNDNSDVASAGSRAAPGLPPLRERVLTFTAALARHAATGFERSAEPEIDARLAVCQSCDRFTGQHCTECGCACGGRQTFLNKLAWKSERCPLGKW